MTLTRDEFEDVRRELARELAMRRRVYPRWISSGKLTQARADEQTRLMQVAYDWICQQLPTTAKLL